MIIVLQRVRSARVEVAGTIVGEIGVGLLILIGIERDDSERELEYLAEKVLNLRIFPDSQQKMNRSVKDVGGSVLTVSQFTLSGETSRGRRPDFTRAERPEIAERLIAEFNRRIAKEIPVQTGVFGAMMDVYLVNDGPVTLILEKKPVSSNPELVQVIGEWG